MFSVDHIEIEITSCSLGLISCFMVMQQSVLPNRASSTLKDSEEEDEEEVEEEDDEEVDGSESSSDYELPVTMIRQDAATQSIQKDLILVLCHPISSL